jgi:hypothetical protein
VGVLSAEILSRTHGPANVGGKNKIKAVWAVLFFRRAVLRDVGGSVSHRIKKVWPYVYFNLL